MARADFDFRATRRRCQVQRTIECRQHPALDVIKRGRLPIAWPRKRRFNFLKDASWPGTHEERPPASNDADSAAELEERVVSAVEPRLEARAAGVGREPVSHTPLPEHLSAPSRLGRIFRALRSAAEAARNP